VLSAGQPLPTDILVHDYLTVGGRKISKSSGVTIDPAALAATYGTDAVRWWLLREVPRVADADFTLERLAARTNDELANGIGNLVSRVSSMIHRYRAGRPPRASDVAPGTEALAAACHRAPGLVEDALAGFDFRQATAAIWAIVDAANRAVNEIRPWELARAKDDGNVRAGRQLDAVLAVLLLALRTLAASLTPFLPDTAARITRQCATINGALPLPRPLFARIAVPATTTIGH
jgi:methionyl-tRNA synthetase